jgi:ribosomal protein S18 acetylase RimI-like enzyme
VDEADMTIRPATAGDAAEIGKLWEKLVAYHQALDDDLPRAARDGDRLYARSIANRLHDSHTRVLVAEENDKVVGYVLGVVVDLVPDMFEQEDGGFLADIYVEENYRGRGIGRALVEALADWFKQGLHHFEWHVAANNPSGLAFWRAIGGRDLMIRMRTDLHQED